MQKTISPAEKKLRYACAAFSLSFYAMDFSDLSQLFCGLIISKGKEFQITRPSNLFSESNIQSITEAISEEWHLPMKEVENHFFTLSHHLRHISPQFDAVHYCKHLNSFKKEITM